MYVEKESSLCASKYPSNNALIECTLLFFFSGEKKQGLSPCTAKYAHYEPSDVVFPNFTGRYKDVSTNTSGVCNSTSVQYDNESDK